MSAYTNAYRSFFDFQNSSFSFHKTVYCIPFYETDSLYKDLGLRGSFRNTKDGKIRVQWTQLASCNQNKLRKIKLTSLLYKLMKIIRY